MRFWLTLLALVPIALAQRNEALHKLLHEYYENRLREFPETATMEGRNEYNDRWTDWSRAGVDRRSKMRSDYLDRLRNFLSGTLSEQDRLNARLLAYLLQREVETEAFDDYFRVNQLFGIHNMIFLTVDVMPRNTLHDDENIIRRLAAVPAYVDQNIAMLNEAISRGFVQPAVVTERVIQQVRTQAGQDPRSSQLLLAFRQWPPNISAQDRERLSARATEVYTQQFVPAWRRLGDFLEKTYLPKARPNIALTSLPGGREMYAAQVRTMTTTAMTAEQVHSLGLHEVKRLESEMLAVAREAGFQGSLTEYEAMLDASADQHFKSKEEMLAYCRNVAKIVEPELPRLFKRIPRLLYGIRAIPPDMEASMASNAQGPAPDWSRPGWFNLNTFEPGKQVRYNKQALVLHEAVPGHVFQGSIALELTDLPEFRKRVRLSAYGEGWGLYAESLGSDLGVYIDAPSRYGRLSSERFRAVRLVVDTGMHSLGWSRAQALDYFRTHAPGNSLAEIDRYIAWPGQALSYKMGQLKILELRRRAEQRLGPKFDIREYHDVVLRNGPLPLELLEEVVDAYIRERGAVAAK